MRVNKSKWEMKLFSDCTSTIKVKDAILKKDYRIEGKYPIISQEKDFISGYCDTIGSLNSLGEVVIFGDHTRVLKFIDFDFCVGADGVKVIKPNVGLSAKYLYYFLTWVNIPSNGYSRHFKFLKEIIIKYPSAIDQKAIVIELDAVLAMIDGYREQLADLNALAQSIFLETFGDPISNSKGWEISTIGENCTLKSGDSSANNFPGGEIPYLKVADMNMQENKFWVKRSSRYVDCGKKTKAIFPMGTIIFPKRGGAITTGKLGIALCPIICDLNIMGVIPNSNLMSEYLYFVFRNVDFSKLYDGTSVPQINNSDISPLRLPLPPLSLQQQFAAQVEAIEKQKEILRQQLADAETLMAERMQYYFSENSEISENSEFSDNSDNNIK